jgi:hypothetical protein
MSLAKALSMFEQRALFFAKLPTLGDRFEGAAPIANDKIRGKRKLKSIFHVRNRGMESLAHSCNAVARLRQ